MFRTSLLNLIATRDLASKIDFWHLPAVNLSIWMCAEVEKEECVGEDIMSSNAARLTIVTDTQVLFLEDGARVHV